MSWVGSHRRFTRWLMTRPPGRGTLAAALVGTVLLLVTTRLPARGLAITDWSLTHLCYVLTPENWGMFYRDPASRSWVDLVLLAGLGVWFVLLGGTLLRVVLRGLARSRHDGGYVRTPWWRWVAGLALLLFSAVLIPVGEEFRLAHHWMASLASYPPAVMGSSWFAGSLSARPPGLTSARQLEVLHTGIRRLPSAALRITAIKVLVEAHAGAGLPILLDALGHETDVSVRVVLLHVIGMYRDKASVAVVAADLDHGDALVRAAAIDAIGIIHGPGWNIPLSYNWIRGDAAVLLCTPPIYYSELVDLSITGGATRPYRTSEDHLRDTLVPLDAAYRARLEAFMLSGLTAGEREAAARALVRWPPENYKLRVAEWGVWISDSEANLTLTQSVLDEIPPFVHRTGNPTGDFKDRVGQIFMITKPIVHFTTAQPLAVDAEVHIHYGRPWFAYPRPDDFDFAAGTRYMDYERDASGKYITDSSGHYIMARPPAPLEGLDPPGGWPKLGPLSTGYPWLSPNHREHGAGSGPMGAEGNEITELGLHWQSLIVTPMPPSFTQLVSVPADPKYQWWTRLRGVPSSYVTSCNETERFLYYDGPTHAKAPLNVALQGTSLTFSVPLAEEHFGFDRDVAFPALRSAAFARRGLFIRVRGGTATAALVGPPKMEAPSSYNNNTVPKPSTLPVPTALAPDAQAQLQNLLTEAGLTAEEAGGLVDAWSPQFFHTEGERFLLIMSAEDYDRFCPLAIAPAPTTLVRVGIVLTEFSGR